MVASLLIRRFLPDHHYIPGITLLSLPYMLGFWRVWVRCENLPVILGTGHYSTTPKLKRAWSNRANLATRPQMRLTGRKIPLSSTLRNAIRPLAILEGQGRFRTRCRSTCESQGTIFHFSMSEIPSTRLRGLIRKTSGCPPRKLPWSNSTLK